MSRRVCKPLFAWGRVLPDGSCSERLPPDCSLLEVPAAAELCSATLHRGCSSCACCDGEPRPLKPLQFSSTAGMQAASCAFLAVLPKPAPTRPPSASSHPEARPPRWCPDAAKRERRAGTNRNLGGEEKQGQRGQKPVLQAKPWGLVVNTARLMP